MISPQERFYLGEELETFAQAQNWKKYWTGFAQRYIRGDVAEVGAGVGGTTPFLYSKTCDSWTCVEPDPDLLHKLKHALATDRLDHCQAFQGTVQELPEKSTFDTILYADVLEHIEDDVGEVAASSQRLRPGGHLIIISPAHQWLFSPFDARIGHFRRYSQADIRYTVPPSLELVALRYLDSVGVLASLSNKVFLRRSMPAAYQLRIWDSYFVPMSRLLDPLFRYRIGKSILGIWQKRAD